MAASDQRAVIAKLRRLLAADGAKHLSKVPRPTRKRPASFSEASHELGVPRSTLHDLAIAHQIPRRALRKTLALRRTFEQLEREGKLTLSKISRLLSIAKSTASTWRQRRLDDQARADFRPRKLRTAKLCTVCGHRVKVWPCVACYPQGTAPHEATSR